ncbi:hypothetical protein [Fluviispira vulneris]|uniref:hypothetical protein n=1 Tax=Fluviispira vulneris TaxID=2763012 RepID=UPI001644B674|nr:hypothetical protein [Fluviispira vulneris]
MKILVSLIIFAGFIVSCGKDKGENVEYAQCKKEDPTNQVCQFIGTINNIKIELYPYDECENDRQFYLKNNIITQNEYNTLVKFNFRPIISRLKTLSTVVDCHPKPKEN